MSSTPATSSVARRPDGSTLALATFFFLSAIGCNDVRQPNQPEPMPPAAGSNAPPAATGPGMPHGTSGDTEQETDLYRLPFDQWGPREVAVDALARIGKPALPPLVEALYAPDPQLRRYAAEALARIGPDAVDAVPDLRIALRDENKLVRKQVIRALGQIGPGAAAAVRELAGELKEK